MRSHLNQCANYFFKQCFDSLNEPLIEVAFFMINFRAILLR